MLTVLLQGVREVEEWMSQTSGIPLEELRPHMFLLRDRDATGHLMRSATLPCTVLTLQALGMGCAVLFWTAWQLRRTGWLTDEHSDVGMRSLDPSCDRAVLAVLHSACCGVLNVLFWGPRAHQRKAAAGCQEAWTPW